jgi:hypothetical protein
MRDLTPPPYQVPHPAIEGFDSAYVAPLTRHQLRNKPFGVFRIVNLERDRPQRP